MNLLFLIIALIEVKKAIRKKGLNPKEVPRRLEFCDSKRERLITLVIGDYHPCEEG